MSQRLLIPALLLALAGLTGWAVAKPGAAESRKADSAGQFAVSAAGSSAVLLDSGTGKTWVLAQAMDGSSVWVPAKRLDTEEEMHQWLKGERERAAERDALQRELLNKLEGSRKKPGRK